MKKSILLISIIIAFVGITNAQNSKIVGTWLLSKVEIGEKIQTPYQINEFNENGKFVVMGIEVGTWEYDIKTNAIIMKSDFDKDFNGNATIVGVTGNNLELSKDNTKMFYTKISMSQLAVSNKNSGLFGMWVFNNVPNNYTNTFVNFTEPDQYKMIQKQEGMTSEYNGTWLFNKQENSLIIIGFNGDNFLRGKNKVKISAETIEIENNGNHFKGKKMEEQISNIEKLAFTENDFYDENGDYKYNEEEENTKLPWLNWSEMKTDLQGVSKLVYNYSVLIEGTESFENKILTANVRASLEEEGFEIDNVFYGYDSKESDLPINNNYSSPLYPLEGLLFNVVGEEQITTPAGTFQCTVLNAVDYSGVLKKLWMLNDKIGVYAKIIEVDTDETFGHYYVYELQEIK
jgi:hypothetical protein